MKFDNYHNQNLQPKYCPVNMISFLWRYGGLTLLLSSIFILSSAFSNAQAIINLDAFNKSNGTKINVKKNIVTVSWPVEKNESGKLVLDLSKEQPLFKSIQLNNKEIAASLDPAFILTIGKRDLISQNGWNIFFDKVPLKPHESYIIHFKKDSASVSSEGAHTVIRVSKMFASTFSGILEITLYNGSPLFKVAAVMSTDVDSTAILYDAGLVNKKEIWNNIGWCDTKQQMQYARPKESDTPRNLEVKYRAVIGESNEGSLAIFPAPHQFFYPLDEAFNLKFTWYGNNYRKMIPGFGMGIRQTLEGDNRFVPWFNAPPGTQQLLSFFCLLSAHKASITLQEVKRFTHSDSYVSLPGYKTMCSHFHNEFIMHVVLAGKPIPEYPNFVKVLRTQVLTLCILQSFITRRIRKDLIVQD